MTEEIEPHLITHGYKLLGDLGCGGYGKVFLAERQNGANDKYAIKLIEPDDSEEEEPELYPPQLEIDIMSRLHHKNVVGFIESFVSDGKVFIVMEPSDNGTLQSYMDRQHDRRVESRIRRSIFAQLVDAVSYIHENGVYHRDIKPENILLNKDMTVKLCDFGLSQWYDPKHEVSQTHVDAEVKDSSSETVGQRSFVKPEVIDVFHLGTVLYEMIEGTRPIRKYSKGQETAKDSKMSYLEMTFASEDEEDIVSRMLHPELEKKISLADIRSHDYVVFSSVTWLPEE